MSINTKKINLKTLAIFTSIALIIFFILLWGINIFSEYEMANLKKGAVQLPSKKLDVDSLKKFNDLKSYDKPLNLDGNDFGRINPFAPR